MKAKKININKTLIFFLLIHLIIWTLVPSISNNNLPLDTIETLNWGRNLDWGYSKHPPISAWLVELVYQIFGNQDWAFYFLSQLFVVLTFFVIFKFSEDFFKNQTLCLISVLLLEGIYFYNFTTPEFNVNVCQLPFWALAVLYCWRSFKDNKTINWALFGLFAALGVLSKYLFIYLLVAMGMFLIYFMINKKFNFKCLISLASFLLLLLPHLIWLSENNYTTINYALHRTGLVVSDISNHFIHPLIFLGKQIVILIPFFIMFLFIVSKIKTKFNFKDKKLLFLLSINVIPIILMFLTSMFMGVKIRTMWMTPFYLFMGVLLVYIFRTKINLHKLKYFISVFLILFILSPLTYLYISVFQTDKRTDFPGKGIALAVQQEWNKVNNAIPIKHVYNSDLEGWFSENFSYTALGKWFSEDLSYYLNSRPIAGGEFNGENFVFIFSTQNQHNPKEACKVEAKKKLAKDLVLPIYYSEMSIGMLSNLSLCFFNLK